MHADSQPSLQLALPILSILALPPYITQNGNAQSYHSSTPNCHTRVVFVNGFHRIGIFASVDIEAGSELFFDYRYSKEEKSKDMHKKAVVVDWMKDSTLANMTSRGAGRQMVLVDEENGEGGGGATKSGTRT